LASFSRFLDLAAAHNGELVNYSAIGRECHLSTKTVQSYYEILEDTLIAVRLDPWIKSLRKRMSAHPKYYLFDLGVSNSINRRLKGGMDPVLRGRLFEQFILLETFRWQKYLNSEACIYFWRTSHGAEVDLIIERNQKIIAAFEIKSSSQVSSSDLSGLLAFREEYPNTPLYIASQVKNDYELKGVTVLCWQNALSRIKQYLTD
jgi:predicted AAA+ superfamily ATPase